MLFLIFLSSFLYGALADGPIADEGYVLNFDSPLYVCPDDGSQVFFDTTDVDIKRYNETATYMTGSIKFLKGIEAATMIELLIEKDIGGSLEMFASHEICDLCKELSDQSSTYRPYLEYFGFSENCPFSPDTFKIQELAPCAKGIPVNSVTAGRYQVTMNYYRNPEGNCRNEKTFIACLKLDFIIEPI